MKKIETSTLENISGGGFWDGFCIGVGAMGVIGGAALALTGVGAAVLVTAEVGCLVYGVATAK